MTHKITIKVLDKTQFSEAENLWNKLEKQVTHPPLVSTWAWVSTWLTHYGDIVNHWFVIGMHDERAVGITLVTQETKRWFPLPVNAYHLGTQGEPLKDWVHMVNNNILVLPTYSVYFTKALTKTLVNNFTWEEFLVDDANTVFADLFYKSANRYQVKTRKVTHSCAIVDLDAMRKEKKNVLDYFSRDTRYQIKRNMKEFGTLEIEYAKTLEEAESIFAELRTLHQASLQKKGKRGSYSSERFTSFHKDLIKTMFISGAIILFRVKSDRLGTLGCFYLMNDNGVAFGYSSGMNDFTGSDITTINVKRLKPGFVMHALCMQACLDAGMSEYNFSTGSEGYKKELTSLTTTLTTIKLQRSLKSSLREMLYEAYLNAEEKKRFQHILKPLYSVYLRVNK